MLGMCTKLTELNFDFQVVSLFSCLGKIRKSKHPRHMTLEHVAGQRWMGLKFRTRKTAGLTYQVFQDMHFRRAASMVRIRPLKGHAICACQFIRFK